MRYYLFILTCILFFSCQTKKKNNKPNWLFGKWERINEKPDKSTFDFWNKDLTGIGFTLKESDTIFKETMSIVTIEDTLHLKIEGVNDTPTLFKFTKQTDSSFVCENEQNEFPKKIYYYKENKQLKCKISNDKFSIDFVFNKIKH
ncbi:hypothetical protein [uncultured Tenacibaculum sp.]|uniref:hypothetical protein n=1 Tax=uncultured Tenacibaculum sp. TaxID=174713 RepID=UPI002618D707|nr:hypothetical protein [uncultured Tenacibaculum sp.]